MRCEEDINIGDDYDLVEAISNDDRDEFIALLERQPESHRPRAQSVLDMVCRRSLVCAEALIKGETPLTVDLNIPCCSYGTGMLPLHQKAYETEPKPSFIELLLFYGARTDIRFNLLHGHSHYKKFIYQFHNMLPLEMALHSILPHYYPDGWTHRDSIYKLITILCLPRLQNHLEAMALLAGTTKETGEIFLECAMVGKIVELACLLMVAPKEKLHDVMDQVQQHCDSTGNNPLLIEEEHYEKLVCVRRLIEVFDMAGDRISAYIKENKVNVCQNKTVRDVKELLTATGINFLDWEVHISDHNPRFRYRQSEYNGSVEFENLRCLDDFGMAHYSKLGYRWEVSSKDRWLEFENHEAYLNELENDVRCLKEKIVKIEKEQQQLNLQIWMDEELWCALKKDDREEFISVLARKEHLFRFRQQQILYAVCCSGSIKCAESLIKGDTPLTVDLNAPCTDTGLYPLHCAALSLFPSITELLIYHGAQIDIRFRPHNPSSIFPQRLVEVHANKLPLHMALHGISCLPCIREWTLRHPIQKLVALLCLPRVQRALETLGLLAMTTKETEKEFLRFAIDGKFVELAALLMAAPGKLSNLLSYGCWDTDLIDEGEREIKEKGLELCVLFKALTDNIAAYVREDKSNVSKHQVVEDLTYMIKATRYLDVADMDLSVYDWYRKEESSYASKALYECGSQLPPDVGMEHYSKTSFRWRGSKRKSAWSYMKRKDYKYKLSNELRRLEVVHEREEKWLQKKMKPTTVDCPYILRQGVPIASTCFFSLKADANNKTFGGGLHGVQKLTSTKAMSSLASSANLRNLAVAITSSFRMSSSSLLGRTIGSVAFLVNASI